ncbi:hypothetical protein LSTR_LSTR014516 [Laodelphax striatellus]|uniref:Enhancer of mRNA-decapping protein 4 C-terminal domain-containing protein n=1 Tax=Laodelphax striatellus TaxID=195883 RepID=A0A482XQG9_LAOST|nr:hypothetical protein LSTR_LSTR014516 [Laodelphax striatellus]
MVESTQSEDTIKNLEETSFSSFQESANKLSNPTTPSPKPGLPSGGVAAFASGGSSPSREVQEIFSSQEPQSYNYPNDFKLDLGMTGMTAEEYDKQEIVVIPERTNEQIHSFSADYTDIKNIANSLAVIQSTITKQQDEIKCLREEVLKLNNPREFEKVLNLIVETMDHLKHNLHLDMTEKLSATDHLLKENINKLVNSKALAFGNLNLVVAVCEKVDPNRIFKTKPCLLSQNILLCLIQQLSSDLTTHTELKRKYLEEAVISLDFKSETTREYAPEILIKLQNQLSAYISSNEGSDFARSFQILLMAVQATANSSNCK